MKTLKTHTLVKAINVLPRADRSKIIAVTALQVFMGVLDLLGVLAIGILGALSVSGLQSSDPGDRISAVMRLLQLESSTFQTQATILAVSSMLLLVGRTILSVFFTRRILFFLSRRGAQISAELISRLLSQPLLFVQSRTTQEKVFAVTTGVERIVLQVIATSVVWVADFSLLVVMMLGLVIVDPITAFATLFVFTIVGFYLHRFMHIRAESMGVANSNMNIKSNEKIVEVFASYRESVVRNRRDYYAREISSLRYLLANTSAEIGFLPYVSKYVIETTVVVGAVLIGSSQFVYQDSSQAIGTLAIFLAAGSRIAPAVLRLQQGAITIQNGLGVATPTLNLIEDLGNEPLTVNMNDAVDILHDGFISEIVIEDVSLTYPSRQTKAIANISLTIPAGTSIALVGPSGSVFISGLEPHLAVSKWPGAVSYVPQDVAITSGTIRENVALGYPAQEATDDLVYGALKIAHLEGFIRDLPEGIDTLVGERGANMSGGQRQRLGIARAMFTRPHLLVLDEATSSLDGDTEANISEAIHSLRGSTTVVIIAHRLSTVRNVDKVVYLSAGKVLAVGTFDEVRKTVPDFDQQARVMGL